MGFSPHALHGSMHKNPRCGCGVASQTIFLPQPQEITQKAKPKMAVPLKITIKQQEATPFPRKS
jgi:hypothetical protein